VLCMLLILRLLVFSNPTLSDESKSTAEHMNPWLGLQLRVYITPKLA
jgi:hypothetical protein